MIDGTDYNVKDIAEYTLLTDMNIHSPSRFLYDIFVHPAFVSHPCPLLIAVNKSDNPKCVDNQVLFKEIEDEL